MPILQCAAVGEVAHGDAHARLADKRAVGIAIRLVVVAVVQRFGRGEGDFAGKHLVNQGLGGVNRDAHADALDGAAGVVRAGVLQRRDAHQFAVHIEHAAAGVAGVNRGVHLNHGVGDGGLAAILVIGFGLNRAVQSADDADRRGLGEAQWVADVDCPVADLQGVAVAQRDRRQVKARRVHNGDIQRFVIRNKRRGVLVGVAAVIRHGHTQAACVLHNVVIRQHEALTDNHARAGSRQLLALLNLLIIVAAVAITEAIAKIEVVAIAAIAHGLIVAHADHAVTHLLHRRGERAGDNRRCRVRRRDGFCRRRRVLRRHRRARANHRAGQAQCNTAHHFPEFHNCCTSFRFKNRISCRRSHFRRPVSLSNWLCFYYIRLFCLCHERFLNIQWNFVNFA